METLEDQLIRKDLVSKAMKVMSPREIEIITQLVLEDRTNAECAASFGVSSTRICQIRDRALRKAMRAIDRGLFVRAQEVSFRSPEECIKIKKLSKIGIWRSKVKARRLSALAEEERRQNTLILAKLYQSQSSAMASLAKAFGYNPEYS